MRHARMAATKCKPPSPIPSFAFQGSSTPIADADRGDVAATIARVSGNTGLPDGRWRARSPTMHNTGRELGHPSKEVRSANRQAAVSSAAATLRLSS